MSKRTLQTPSNGGSPVGGSPTKKFKALEGVPSSVSSTDRPSKPEYIKITNDVLGHKDNKEFLDASESRNRSRSVGQRGILREERENRWVDRFRPPRFAENIVLATASDGQPFARYHIHRGFVKDSMDEETGLLYTTTDMAMPKGELNAFPSLFHPLCLPCPPS
jgi:hypothetical protein